jgi:uncharacterized peroxidase-related enzyme
MNDTIAPLFSPLQMADAPERSKQILKSYEKSSGFIPNLIAKLANNPTVLQGYLALEDVYSKGSFTPSERQIILLATSVENKCNYCTTVHSTIAMSFLYTSSTIVAAVLNGTPVPDAKLDSLVTLVREIVRERGHVKDKTIQDFIASGYQREQVMELLLGIALKTISNYLDHISPTPVDEAFASGHNQPTPQGWPRL